MTPFVAMVTCCQDGSLIKLVGEGHCLPAG